MFFQTGDGVWLTTDIPVEYLQFQPWSPIKESNADYRNELIREIGSQPLHFLFPRLEYLDAVWKAAANEAVLFQNRETGKCIMIALSAGQEVRNLASVETFSSLADWMEKCLLVEQQSYYRF